MTQKLRHYLDQILNSLWFYPALMAAGAIVLARVALTWGKELPIEAKANWFVYSGDMESARDLLSSLLTGMFTMTALVVTSTMVVLTLAAGQLGARLIRTFIRDRKNQAVLGLFVGTIVYIVMVVRNLNDVAFDEVPHVAVTLGTFFSLVCLMLLAPYVHKLARTIMHDSLVGAVRREAIADIERLLPEDPEDAAAPEVPQDAAWTWLERDGYVDAVDYPRICRAAAKAGATVWTTVHPSSYVVRGRACIAVHPPERCTDELRHAIRESFVLGSERSSAQDAEFGVSRLVEISVRSMSPSINDPFTAISAVDAIASILARALQRRPEHALFRDDAGIVRVVRKKVAPAHLVAAAFDPLRDVAAGNPQVILRLLDQLKCLVAFAQDRESREALFEQVRAVAAAAERSLHDRDLVRVEERLRAVPTFESAVLSAGSGGSR
ncbi:MAG TPA: DUF2254 domain-containing protein [Beijerinckiaceae bacterium]|nr:DUF2254 domain-containing protein [Beijerinckiaceae bacterium]